jgi:2-phosphosulfolactate phosphatase
MPKLDLYLLPRLAPREALADATVIVVDLLRASTTIATALAAGAACVMPFAEIDETLAAAERFGRDNVLLGGERGGQVIPGFDLGNSPAEYTAERVAGRRILFTTTNGARALHHARDARRVLVGAAVNRLAVALTVSCEHDAVVLCAGTDGVPAREDMLAGGAIIDALCGVVKNGWELGDEASNAHGQWQALRGELGLAAPSLVDRFAAELRDTDGGRNLIDIGQDADLPACAQLDVLTVVPELNPSTNELRPA